MCDMEKGATGTPDAGCAIVGPRECTRRRVDEGVLSLEQCIHVHVGFFPPASQA